MICDLGQALAQVERFDNGIGRRYFGGHKPTADLAFQLALYHRFMGQRMGEEWNPEVRSTAVGLLMDYALRRLREASVSTTEDVIARGNPRDIALLFSHDDQVVRWWMKGRMGLWTDDQLYVYCQRAGGPWLDDVIIEILALHHARAEYNLALAAELLEHVFKLSHAPHCVRDQHPKPMHALFGPLKDRERLVREAVEEADERGLKRWIDM